MVAAHLQASATCLGCLNSACAGAVLCLESLLDIWQPFVSSQSQPCREHSCHAEPEHVQPSQSVTATAGRRRRSGTGRAGRGRLGAGQDEQERNAALAAQSASKLLSSALWRLSL